MVLKTTGKKSGAARYAPLNYAILDGNIYCIAGWGNPRPNGSWFKLGFPSGYVSDVLHNLEALCEAGDAGDPRLRPAAEWLLSKQHRAGRWKNEYAYNGKTWVNFERLGEPSKRVTLRACHVLSQVYDGAARSIACAPT